MSEIDVQRQQLLEGMAGDPHHPAYANVTAVGIGVRDQDGAQPELVVFHEPVAECEFAEAKEFISNASGGPVVFAPAERFYGLQSPYAGGSIGVYAPGRYNIPPENAGTLGGKVAVGGKSYVLGCNHALAYNGRADGAAVVYPGPLDDIQGHEIARMAAFIPLTPAKWPTRVGNGPVNPVDCALAELSGAVDAPTIVNPVQTTVPFGTTVRKKGRTTGFTNGKVRIQSLQYIVDLSFGTFLYDGHMAVVSVPPPQPPLSPFVPFANPGDSGSMVVGDPAPPGGTLAGIGLVTARTYCSSGPYQGYVVSICPLATSLAMLAPQIGSTLAQMEVTTR